MTDYAEQIRIEQVAALAAVKRVAESLPGFEETGFAMSGKLNEARVPDAVNVETPPHANVRVHGGQR